MLYLLEAETKRKLSMAKRSYDQYCALARALDVLGERWTLLLVRELLLGQKRFSDLLAGLPGIGPNVLSARLKLLQAEGVVRQTKLAPPAASVVYELTERGRELEPAVLALGRWGVQLLGPRKPADRHRLGWLLLGMRMAFHPEAARGITETYEFRVEDETFTAEVDDGSIDVRHGAAVDPDVVIESNFETMVALGSGQMTSREALDAGMVRVDGDPDAAVRCARMLTLTGGRR